MRKVFSKYLPEITYIVVFSVLFMIFLSFLRIWFLRGVAVMHPYILLMGAIGSLALVTVAVVSIIERRKRAD